MAAGGAGAGSVAGVVSAAAWGSAPPLLVGVAVAVVGGLLVVAWALLAARDHAAHARLPSGVAVDLDAFLGGGRAGAADVLASYATQVAVGAFRGRMSPGPVPLEVVPPGGPGAPWGWATVRRRAVDAPGLGPGALEPRARVLVGTLRMGYGHMRIAHAIASYAAGGDDDGNDGEGVRVAVVDLLGLECAEAGLVRKAEERYSQLSRVASEAGGAVERLWGAVTLSGDARLVRSQWRTAQVLVHALSGWPDKDTPFVATHPLMGFIAVLAGFTRVVNCVIDNTAQFFVMVPGAQNLCQGPAQCLALGALGGAGLAAARGRRLRTVGHWVARDVAENAAQDCARRKRRVAADPAAPVRVLIPFGGAGAQTRYLVTLLRRLAPLVDAGRVDACVNCGDHPAALAAVLKTVEAVGLRRRLGAHVRTGDALGALARAWASDASLPGRIHVCSFLGGTPEDHFLAVHATDALCRGADVLMCKPSELAFVPVPKIMLRRVGDHEARNALRASEIGDGTPECRSPDDAARCLEVLLAERDRGDPHGWWPSMCDRIISLCGPDGVYRGAHIAVTLACSGKGGT